MSQQKQQHWLYRAENRRKFWYTLIALMALSLLPELFLHHHAHFADQGILLEAQPGFYPWFGFVSCAIMVLIAKLLSFVLKRKDDYYDE
ncbi:MAG: hypothetical protein CSB47_00790 [Proteobacteria bacterium]|nr:MAG: hypothetical protein CSB47_00790 [Pseudomonadota bacterium]